MRVTNEEAALDIVVKLGSRFYHFINLRYWMGRFSDFFKPVITIGRGREGEGYVGHHLFFSLFFPAILVSYGATLG